jgi:hypothetical protein
MYILNDSKIVLSVYWYFAINYAYCWDISEIAYSTSSNGCLIILRIIVSLDLNNLIALVKSGTNYADIFLNKSVLAEVSIFA